MPSQHAFTFISALSQVLVKEREKQGLSKNELSSRSGLDRAALIRAERGDRNPGIAFYYDWCRALGLKFSAAIKRAESQMGSHNE